jgi:hypothetical protein
MTRDAFMTALQSQTSCLLSREPVPAGDRCLRTEAARVDASTVVSFLCMPCSRAVGTVAQIDELTHADA